MHKIRVYTDTSVFGGAFEDIFAVATLRLFRRVEAGEFTVLISALTLTELESAPAHVLALYDNLPAKHLERIDISDEITSLAEAYLAAGVLFERNHSDAIHVAAASVARADVLVSWNFKHIVNFGKIKAFNGINQVHQYPEIAILSPLEMMNDEENGKKV